MHTEEHGIETELGPSYIPNKRIPLIIEDAIRCLQEKGLLFFVNDSLKIRRTLTDYGTDLSTEGIFRKNGNIKRLKTFCENCDKDPKSVDFQNDNPVQIAATLKKYLRDLPDPLLTFKLFKVFVSTQKLGSEEKRVQALQYACCLLPRPNLHVLQVLMWFMEEVSCHAGMHQDWGNKMDLDNLATVITPNILYASSAPGSSHGGWSLDPALSDSLASTASAFEAIKVIKTILTHQQEIWQVPSSILKALEELEDKEKVKEGVQEREGREIIKRYKKEVLRAKNLMPGISFPGQPGQGFVR